MKPLLDPIVVASVLAITLHAPGTLAYGGGGSSSVGCAEPQFYEELPAKNAVVAELAEVFVVASDNVDVQTLELEVGTQRLPPAVTVRRSGELEVRAKLPLPIRQPGKVRIALSAKSKDGCAGFHPYFIEVKP
ncbi:MAG: hypothetical protein FIA97_00115 [Methylococcaceae bacterium]|nr:hypothetical protein [Methylococcaceae bacterium]